MKRISTHILDVGRGMPAAEVPVRLERQEALGEWRLLQETKTDSDGRCGQLLPDDRMPPGVYRLVFDTAAYFNANKVDGLYPRVEVMFHVRDRESAFHIPLLLNANGYTTYRGS
ncbi:MAG TPA: hydroxyisourate hydrolase [Candidatus Sulfotelmatobacter sp.]|nr:hydroxyisourate hydrolase [Candidatus Sulfotelmatobacter sp.]